MLFALMPATPQVVAARTLKVRLDLETKMLRTNETPVMDVLPWPNGKGFNGSSEWWEYVMTKDERRRLDNLMGLALLDPDVCDRLLTKRDETLMKAFGLSTQTQAWLRGLQATSLSELAQAIVAKAPQLA
nr:MAG: hypothetical protein DIU68_09360 [Chloroflexota bacterium]